MSGWARIYCAQIASGPVHLCCVSDQDGPAVYPEPLKSVKRIEDPGEARAYCAARVNGRGCQVPVEALGPLGFL